MAELTGGAQVFHANTSTVDTAVQVTVGTRSRDAAGNEYIYLKGVAATGAGSWVTYNLNTGTTAVLTANAVGPVAIAMAAVVADRWGWYQIFGKNTIASTDTIAANLQLYIDGSDGRADDADVAGDAIIGATSLTADTSNVATVMLTYPYTSNVAID